VLSAVAARAEQLRLAGNKEFKAGRLQEAMQQYSQAVQQLPSDALLYNNISLVQLKLGRIDEVWRGPALYHSRIGSMLCMLVFGLQCAVYGGTWQMVTPSRLATNATGSLFMYRPQQQSVHRSPVDVHTEVLLLSRV
jgi:tetratricopeptide (TPR) repeat protein